MLLASSTYDKIKQHAAPVCFCSTSKYALYIQEVGPEDADLAERLAATGRPPNLTNDPNLLRIEWVALRRLIDRHWRKHNLHAFADQQACAALPVLQKLVSTAAVDVSDALLDKLAAVAVERRIAPDGLLYSRQDFLDYFGRLDEWHAAPRAELPEVTAPPPAPSVSPDADSLRADESSSSASGLRTIVRPSKRGQAYRCPECEVLFDCSTHKWGAFLEHFKGQHPGVTAPKRKDPGVIVELDAKESAGAT